jgi:polyphosphate kinase 2 (PPK2 family)
VWRRRYRHINDWERMLADEGTTIRKFFVYIDRDEQRARLQARLDDPDKRWKFSARDLPERARWNDYVKAFEEVLERTSTEWAPWYLIPANRKWFRNLAVAHILGETLADLHPTYPRPEEGLEGIVIPT